jgi:hypothetical protein
MAAEDEGMGVRSPRYNFTAHVFLNIILQIFTGFYPEGKKGNTNKMIFRGGPVRQEQR